MMPAAVNTAKKPNSFSIDSLMAKDTDRDSREGSPASVRSPSPREARAAPRSPASTPERTPHPQPASSSGFQPVVPGFGAAAAAFLQGINGGKLSGGHFDSHGNDHLPLHFGSEGMSGLHPGLAHGGHLGLPNPLHCGAGSMPLGLANSAQQMGMHHLLLGHHSRESFSPYLPWFLSRHGNLLGHRFAGPDASLLLQPFRKPKRIRTAFSPSQLLRLEHAFEKNHYVVGQERKDLAANLSLTETQVKVWFQNRRTKYKRMKAENEEDGGVKSGGEEGRSSGAPGSPSGLESPVMSDEMDSEQEEEEMGDRSPGMSPGGSLQRNKTSHHINRWRVETNQV